jgi:hypothetical protein
LEREGVFRGGDWLVGLVSCNGDVERPGRGIGHAKREKEWKKRNEGEMPAVFP